MTQQAVSEWKRIEKALGENLFTDEKYRPFKSLRTTVLLSSKKE